MFNRFREIQNKLIAGEDGASDHVAEVHPLLQPDEDDNEQHQLYLEEQVGGNHPQNLPYQQKQSETIVPQNMTMLAHSQPKQQPNLLQHLNCEESEEESPCAAVFSSTAGFKKGIDLLRPGPPLGTNIGAADSLMTSVKPTSVQ